MHAQHGEDDFIKTLFPEGYVGHYVDIGANHPVYASNTYLLYQSGWSGICMEPHTIYNDEYAEKRPLDRLLNIAAGSAEGDAQFHFSDGLEGLSSLAVTEAIHTQTKTVAVRRLDTVLSEAGFAPTFDVLSVDVEGLEIDVLSTLGSFAPHIIIAEFNSLGAINTDLQPYLSKLGYQTLLVTETNIVCTNDFAKDYPRH